MSRDNSPIINVTAALREARMHVHRPRRNLNEWIVDYRDGVRRSSVFRNFGLAKRHYNLELAYLAGELIMCSAVKIFRAFEGSFGYTLADLEFNLFSGCDLRTSLRLFRQRIIRDVKVIGAPVTPDVHQPETSPARRRPAPPPSPPSAAGEA